MDIHTQTSDLSVHGTATGGNIAATPQHTCPHCGRCLHCGGAPQLYVQLPFYPSWGVWGVWGVNTPNPPYTTVGWGGVSTAGSLGSAN